MTHIQIQWTTDRLEEARSVAKALLEKRWVACVQILPHVDALYHWKGRLCQEKEIQVFLKTKEVYFAQVRDFIAERTHYEVPEILKIFIAEAHPSYVAWMSEELADR